MIRKEKENGTKIRTFKLGRTKRDSARKEQTSRNRVYGNHFSNVDKTSNDFLAKEYGGVVVGLMWVDPKFRLKFWYVDEDGNEHSAKTILDDEGVRAAMPKKDLKMLRSIVEKNENPELFSRKNAEKASAFTELFRIRKNVRLP